MLNLEEVRTRQNLFYKGSGMEIGLVPMRIDEWKYPKPRVACRWLLYLSTPIELCGATVLEWTEGYPVTMASFSVGKDYE